MGDAAPVPVITLEPCAAADAAEGAGSADTPRSTAPRRTKKAHHHHRRDDEDPRGIVVREPSAPPPLQQQQQQQQQQHHQRSKSTNDRSESTAAATPASEPVSPGEEVEEEENGDGQDSSSKSKGREKRRKPRSLSLVDEPELPRETPAAPLTPGQGRTAERRRRLTRAARMSPSEIRTVMLSISADDIPSLARASLSPGDDTQQQQQEEEEEQQQHHHRTRRAASAAAEIPSTAAACPASPVEDPAAALSPPHRLADVSRQQQEEDSDEDGNEDGSSRRGAADEKAKGRLSHARFFSLNRLKPLRSGGSTPTPRAVRSPLLSPLFAGAPSPRRPAAVVGAQNARVFTMSLEEVVREPDLCAQFYEYLQRLNASEGLEFLVRLESLHAREAEPGASPARLHRKACAMVQRFICEGAELELNLSSTTRAAIVAQLTAPGADTRPAPSEVFQEARVEVLNMLGSTLYGQWIASLH